MNSFHHWIEISLSQHILICEKRTSEQDVTADSKSMCSCPVSSNHDEIQRQNMLKHGHQSRCDAQKSMILSISHFLNVFDPMIS